jgi:hypothetical protein
MGADGKIAAPRREQFLQSMELFKRVFTEHGNFFRRGRKRARARKKFLQSMELLKKVFTEHGTFPPAGGPAPGGCAHL